MADTSLLHIWHLIQQQQIRDTQANFLDTWTAPKYGDFSFLLR